MTKTLSADVLAGLSIAGLLLPEAVAYSGVANLPPQAGVIALLAGLVCYGLIGRSRFAIVSATSSSAAVLASAMLALGANTAAERVALASALVMGTGIAFALAGCLRLGAMSNLIARPVLRGYAFGLALVIAVKQWPQLVDMHASASGFFALLSELVRGFSSWQLPSLGCGLAALAGLFVLERIARVPGALVVIVASIAASGFLAAHGVVLTGPIHLAPRAAAIHRPAGALAAARRVLPRADVHPVCRVLWLDPHLRAQTRRSACNPTATCSPSGSPTWCRDSSRARRWGRATRAPRPTRRPGAQSRFAGLCAAAIVLALVLLFLRWIERIPQPVLAAIVIHAVSRSLRVGVFRNYFRWQRDRLVALAAVLAVMLFGVLNGLLVAIAFSVAMLLKALASPRLSVLGRVGEHDYVSVVRFPKARILPGMLVLRPDEPLFFANAEPLFVQAREQVLRQPADDARGPEPRGVARSGQYRARGPGRVLQLAERAWRGAAPGAPEGRGARRAAAREPAAAVRPGPRLLERGRCRARSSA